MSAPSIPNLLSLRGGRGGRGGLRTRRGGGPGGAAGAHHDATIQGTDTDAAVSRLSAVDVGYLEDPYAAFFVSRMDGPPQRRFPIINRGTYTRTTALDRLIDLFLSPGKEQGGEAPARQIVSLGAGTDTRPFRLFSQSAYPHLTYHEIDFEVTSRRKLQTVQGNPQLSRVLTNAAAKNPQTWTATPVHGGAYYCHGMDLRDLDAAGTTDALDGLRTDVPTLVLSECCLCYLKVEESERVLRYFASRIAAAVATVVYEPVHLDDAFGKTMVSNLAARGIHMPGMDRYRNAKDQIQRLLDGGFGAAECKSVEAIWEAWVDAAEKERVDQLEGLDEVEEWKLLAGHYVVVWGVKGEGLESMFRPTT